MASRQRDRTKDRAQADRRGLKSIAAEANEDGGEAAPIGDYNETAGNEPQIIESQRSASAQDAGTETIPSQPVALRAGTKISDVIAMLEKGAGATIDEIVAATRWLPHTARAARPSS